MSNKFQQLPRKLAERSKELKKNCKLKKFGKTIQKIRKPSTKYKKKHINVKR